MDTDAAKLSRRIETMDNTRVIGPPMAFLVISGVAVMAATVAVVLDPRPVSVAFAALAALAVWRTLRLGVYIEGNELVIANIRKAVRVPLDEADVRARVIDPRQEGYSAASAFGYPAIPADPDDNTPRAAKWYELVHGEDRFHIDALMGRWPANHERLALQLRNTILAARDAR